MSERPDEPLVFQPDPTDPQQGMGWFVVGQMIHGVWKYRNGYQKTPSVMISTALVKELAAKL